MHDSIAIDIDENELKWSFCSRLCGWAGYVQRSMLIPNLGSQDALKATRNRVEENLEKSRI